MSVLNFFISLIKTLAFAFFAVSIPLLLVLILLSLRNIEKNLSIIAVNNIKPQKKAQSKDKQSDNK